MDINRHIHIADNELEFDFIRSSGPGGQNINKVATAVQLRFNVDDSPSLEPEIKLRLKKIAGSRMTSEGELVIEAKQYRTQEQNKQAAVNRLVELVRTAAQKPKYRYRTRPGRAAREERLSDKHRRGKIKRARRVSTSDLE